jgi:sec-independent protein translocase protein TatB
MGEIFGVGIEELLFIGILIALLFGPENIPRIARSAGRLINRLVRSPYYREGQQIRQQIRDLPAALARLAELEEIQKNINSEISGLKHVIESEARVDLEEARTPPSNSTPTTPTTDSAPDAGAPSADSAT